MKHKFLLVVSIIIFSLSLVCFAIITNAENKEKEKNGGIEGIVFIDNNCNGERNGNDRGMGGVTITLKPGNQTASTNPGGNYHFSGLSAGIYTVSIAVPAGYCSTTPTTLTIVIKNKNVSNEDFGIIRIPISPDGRSCCS